MCSGRKKRGKEAKEREEGRKEGASHLVHLQVVVYFQLVAESNEFVIGALQANGLT
jgi:hypothetical protein